MMDRILEQSQAIKRVFAKERRPPVTLTWQDEAVLESLNAALKPVADFTDILSAEDYVTVSSLLPMLKLLEGKILAPDEEENPLTTEIKVNILAKLQSKYGNESMKQLMRIATLLDPRYRGDHDDNLEETKAWVIGEMTTLSLGQDVRDVPQEELQLQPTPPKKMSLGSLLGKKEAPSTSLSVEGKIAAEVDTYLRKIVIDGEENPLIWWKTDEKRFPIMAKLARKYLCVCATSTASERLFTKVKELHQLAIMKQILLLPMKLAPVVGLAVAGRSCKLTTRQRRLFGPGRTPLTVVGVAREVLQCGDRTTTEDVYVLKHLKVALLSRPASVRLRLVARVDSIDLATVKQIYPKLCRGLGLIQQKYTIKLNPDTKPVSLKVPRRVPLPLMGKVKKELERIEQLGVISRIEEPTEWCSGMVVAPKKSGEIRICVDLSPLNNAVCREKFVLPSVDQTLGMPSDAVIFSKLDANMGFWQVPLSQECAHYTTFITPFGRYYFNRLPFGTASAPEHFQNRMVTEVTAGLEGVVCHMDDILIWGWTQAEHDARVHTVLERAQKAGVTLNTAKCDFSKPEVKFLRYIISAGGARPDPDKTRAVQEMDQPSNVSELRSFLGMVNQLGSYPTWRRRIRR
ncbi:hypothetical protein SKAU_G00424660 [Synaphobranchus kaupii]|uniref:ribonuclease H n=1 Tax=Synaphobranchus kaupii TaxID=118154 RepID=A0A9Q1E5N1_SYNKA|nr:hypothetical protein SKAU_G00424660 [Synaphobranchus kaupii]